jgi:hypothetical protein
MLLHKRKLAEDESPAEQGEKSRKQIQKEIKRQRIREDDPTKDEFKGPWAVYPGMESFEER